MPEALLNAITVLGVPTTVVLGAIWLMANSYHSKVATGNNSENAISTVMVASVERNIELEDSRFNLSQQLGDLKGQVGDLTRRLVTVEQDLIDSHVENDNLTQQVKELKATVDELRDQLTTARADAERAEAEKMEFKREVETLRARIVELEGIIRKLKDTQKAESDLLEQTLKGESS